MESAMKTLVVLGFSLILLGLAGCNEPLPLAIVNDVSGSSSTTVEVISQSGSGLDGVGYDSLGGINSIPKSTTLINMVGIKNTIYGNTTQQATATVTIFDLSSPVYLNNTLLGYKSLTPGDVFFKGIKAEVAPYRIKLRVGGTRRDTIIGKQYVLGGGIGSSIFANNFPYNKEIDIAFKSLSLNHTFLVSTPEEVKAKLIIKGGVKTNNLTIALEWNGDSEDSVQIIMGGREKGSLDIIPIFRVVVPDNGKFQLPEAIVKNFPYNRHEFITFSVIRNRFYRGNVGGVLKDYHAYATSIHNISIAIP